MTKVSGETHSPFFQNPTIGIITQNSDKSSVFLKKYNIYILYILLPEELFLADYFFLAARRTGVGIYVYRYRFVGA